MKPKPKRSVLIAARLITAIVSLLGAEGVLWLGGYPNWREQELTVATEQFEADRDLGWKNREGVFELVTPFRKIPFQHTSWSGGRRATGERDGRRDGSAKPRLLFFGDSYVEGYGLADAETLPWILQKRHPELEVTNFGTCFYATYQSFLSMEKADVKGATVYYLFNGFHEGRNVGEPSWVRIVKPPPPGFFFPYAELEDGSIVGRRSGGQMVWDLSRRLRLAALVQDYYQIARSRARVRSKRQVTEMLLAQMDETVRARAGKFEVILFDLSAEQRKSYRTYLAARKIAFVDCNHLEMTDRSLRLADGHPSARLNDLLAGWIEPKQVTRNSGR